MRIACCTAALMLAGCSVSTEVSTNIVVGNDTENAAEPAPVENISEPAAPPAASNEQVPQFDAENYPELQGVPAEVLRWVDRRQGCEHWAGEPGWDKERQKQIDEAVAELCPGIDKALGDLRVKYAKDPNVIAALKEYEPLGMD